jgi:hypothetical protein
LHAPATRKAQNLPDGLIFISLCHSASIKRQDISPSI